MKDEIKVEYQQVDNPHIKERLFRALSMLIGEDDLSDLKKIDHKKKI